MNRANLYLALTKVAWAYVLLHVNFSLGTLNLLPNWAAYLLLWQAIALLGGDLRDLTLLKPFCVLLGVWDGADWLCALFGTSLEGLTAPFHLILAAVSVYFHFQLLTDLALLAESREGCGGLARPLRLCRNIDAVLTTLLVLPLPWQRVEIVYISLAIFGLGLALLIMYYLFSLRKGFESPDPQTERPPD